MQEAGIPVTYGYISDLHERKPGTTGCTTAGADSGFALGPGDACYVNNAKAYDDAFATFFDRLAADGITPANTLFVINSEENDHFAGGTPNRAPADQRRHLPAATVSTVACSYAGRSDRRAQRQPPGPASPPQFGNTTAFDVEPQGASIYVHGQPGPSDPTVRQLERDVAHITADNPYNGTTGEKIVNYQAGKVEQRILHIETADPLRTPTFTVFPKGDYFFGQGPQNCTTPCVSTFSRFAWDHGYYSPNIDITWSGFVGPGVAPRGVDGPGPSHGADVLDPHGERHGASVQQHRHVGRRARHPPDDAVARRVEGRLPDRRSGDHRDPPPRPARPARHGDVGRLLQAAQRRCRRVRHEHAARRVGSARQRLVGRRLAVHTHGEDPPRSWPTCVIRWRLRSRRP